jgi:hypothetical protein
MEDHVRMTQVLSHPGRTSLPAPGRVRVGQHDNSQFHCSLI